MDNIFEFASKNKLRFQFNGQISVEDLWDLSVDDLDGIFKKLNKEAKAAEEESLLATKKAGDDVLAVKIAIIKEIVTVKLAEKAEREQAKERKAKKQQIMALIAEKDSEAMRNMSKEDLEKLLADL